jgi:NADPH2 dehydrogenase
MKPDLPVRLKKNIRLAYPDTSKFFDKESEVGYDNYPFAEEERAAASASDEEVGPTKFP